MDPLLSVEGNLSGVWAISSLLWENISVTSLVNHFEAFVINDLISHHFGLDSIPGIGAWVGMWSPGQTVFLRVLWVLLKVRPQETPRSMPTSEILDNLYFSRKWTDLSIDPFLTIWSILLPPTGAGYHYKGQYVESLIRKMRDGYAMSLRNWSEPLMLVAMIGKFMAQVRISHLFVFFFLFSMLFLLECFVDWTSNKRHV